MAHTTTGAPRSRPTAWSAPLPRAYRPNAPQSVPNEARSRGANTPRARTSSPSRPHHVCADAATSSFLRAASCSRVGLVWGQCHARRGPPRAQRTHRARHRGTRSSAVPGRWRSIPCLPNAPLWRPTGRRSSDAGATRPSSMVTWMGYAPRGAHLTCHNGESRGPGAYGAFSEMAFIIKVLFVTTTAHTGSVNLIIFSTAHTGIVSERRVI